MPPPSGADRREALKVIGIDPGLRSTGWGIIETDGSSIVHVANGTCCTEPGPISDRLLALHRQLSNVFLLHQPDEAAVEKTFVNVDAADTLKLGQARAIAVLVPAQAGLKVGEYAPNSIKKAVVGVGHAPKEQIKRMVRACLPGAEIRNGDAADALAIALTHCYRLVRVGKLEAAVARAEAAR